MAYLEITGLPMKGPINGFEPTVNLSMEKGRGLTVLSSDGRLSMAVVDALVGKGTFLGEIYLNGMRIDQVHPRNRKIRLLGDIPGIIPTKTIRENMEYALLAQIVTEGEVAMLVERELTEGPLAGLGESRASMLDSGGCTILAATRALFSGCDLLLVPNLPVPGGRREKKTYNPGIQLDTLLDLKSLFRRLKATWISLLVDPMAVHILSDRVAVFSGGSLVQEGGLRECINAPASRMVADFLSFPRINYRQVTVERDGPYLMLRSGRYGFHVSEYIKRALNAREGDKVILGVRPEDLGIRPFETGDPTVLNLAKVMGVDVLPSNLVVRLDLEGDQWFAMIEPNRPFHTGQLVELRPDPDRIHLFHPLHGVNLLD